MSKRRDNNEGSVFFDKNKGKYCAKLSTGAINASGNERVKTKLFKTEREAKKWLKLQKDLKARGELDFNTSSGVTLVTLATRLNDEKRALNKIKLSTYGRNQDTIKALKKAPISKIPIQKVTANDIIYYYSSLTAYSQSCISKQTSVVRQAFRYAVNKGLVRDNIALNIPIPKAKKKTRKVLALTLEQQKQFINDVETVKEPYRSMLLIMLYTGLRPSEVSALNFSDVDLFKRIINVRRTIQRTHSGASIIANETKTTAGVRSVPLTDEAVNIFKAHYKRCAYSSGLIFRGKNKNRGEIITAYTVNVEFKKIAPASDYSQYCLRHTFATRCIESGMNVKVLSKILGHSSIRITLDTYCDVFDDYSTNSITQFENYLKQQKLVENL